MDGLGSAVSNTSNDELSVSGTDDSGSSRGDGELGGAATTDEFKVFMAELMQLWKQRLNMSVAELYPKQQQQQHVEAASRYKLLMFSCSGSSRKYFVSLPLERALAWVNVLRVVATSDDFVAEKAFK
jgi:hypothetical protein